VCAEETFFSICYTLCVTFTCNCASRAWSGLNRHRRLTRKARLRRARTRVYEMLKERPKKKKQKQALKMVVAISNPRRHKLSKEEQSRKQRRSNQQRRLVAKTEHEDPRRRRRRSDRSRRLASHLTRACRHRRQPWRGWPRARRAASGRHHSHRREPHTRPWQPRGRPCQQRHHEQSCGRRERR
jgi:hypothetical protein